MKVAQIAELDLSRASISALLDLPEPESLNPTGTPKQVVAALDSLFSIWQQIVIKKAEIPLERYEWTCLQGHKHGVEGEDLRGRLLLSVSGYFDFLVVRFLAGGPRKGEWPFPNALRIDAFKRFVPDKDSVQENPRISEFRIFSFNYFCSLFSLYFTSLFRDRPVPKPLCAQFEDLAHDGLRARAKITSQIGGDSVVPGW